jgi:hypothetical protein
MRTFESDRTDVVTVGASPLSRVRWSSVLAGTVAFLSVALLVWGLAFGIVTLLAHPTAASTRAGALALWIAAMGTTIIGSVVGGWFAGRALSGASRGSGATHGFLTWGVALLISFGFQMFALRGLVSAAVSEASDSAAVNAPPEAQPDAASDQSSWRVARDYLAGAGWSWFATWLIAGVAASAAGAAACSTVRRSSFREPSDRVDEVRRGPLTPTTVP